MIQKSNHEKADLAAREEQAALQRQIDDAQASLSKIQATQKAINDEKDQLIVKLQAAKTKEDQDAINAQIQDNQRRAAAAQQQAQEVQQTIKRNTAVHPKCKDNDPLCGM